MTYFKDFEFVKYDFALPGESPRVEVITDLTRGISLEITEKAIQELTDTHVISEGMKPEEVAHILYGDPLLHWTILYVNNIVNINAEWPLDEHSLMAFVTKKYGANNEYAIHHYIRPTDGVIIDGLKEYKNADTGEIYNTTNFCHDTYNIDPIAITNYDYESELNFMKSIIKTVKVARMPTFLAGFKR